ncbi:MAG: hypothetical protein ACLP9Y_27400 [Mycobacterium sp.]
MSASGKSLNVDPTTVDEQFLHSPATRLQAINAASGAIRDAFTIGPHERAAIALKETYDIAPAHAAIAIREAFLIAPSTPTAIAIRDAFEIAPASAAIAIRDAFLIAPPSAAIGIRDAFAIGLTEAAAIAVRNDLGSHSE